jgi:hypothetical protein
MAVLDIQITNASLREITGGISKWHHVLSLGFQPYNR